MVDPRLENKTFAILGPEEMTFAEAVSRVATVIDRRPLMLRLPVSFHYLLAWVAEKIMTTPLTSTAQVQMLAEGIVEPLPFAEDLPTDLLPRASFSASSIKAALPHLERFGCQDLLCARR